MSDAKLIRGQLRQILREVGPELITESVVDAIERRLLEYTKIRLTKMEERQKDIQNLVLRMCSQSVNIVDGEKK